MTGWFLRHSRASLIRITSGSRTRWSRFDWLVAKQPIPTLEEPPRKNTQRGRNIIPDHRNSCCGSNPHKDSSLNHKRKFRRADPPDPTCRDEVGLIADYVVGRLNPPVLAAFEKHLGQCPDCTAFLNTYKKTIEATKSFLKTRSLKISPKPLKLPPKRPGLLDALFWLHLFIFNAYLMT